MPTPETGIVCSSLVLVEQGSCNFKKSVRTPNHLMATAYFRHQKSAPIPVKAISPLSQRWSETANQSKMKTKVLPGHPSLLRWQAAVTELLWHLEFAIRCCVNHGVSLHSKRHFYLECQLDSYCTEHT